MTNQTSLTTAQITALLDLGNDDYLNRCAWCFYQSDKSTVKEDWVRRYASHTDVLDGHDSDLDSQTYQQVADYLQSHAETL